MSYETVEGWPWEKLVSKDDLVVLNICLVAKTFLVKRAKIVVILLILVLKDHQ